MDDIDRLDYTQEPPGTTRDDIELGIPSPSGFGLIAGYGDEPRAARWRRHKANNPPPGLRPHLWADLGEPFRHAFVTPLGFTLPDTVGVTRDVALAAAWRWYDFGLALVNTGKPGFSWPGVLDAHPADLFGNNLVIREEAARG